MLRDVRTANEINRDERETKDAEDFGYISATLFLDGPQSQYKVEKKPEFPGYLRYLIRFAPEKIPPLQTDEAKSLYNEIYKEIYPEKSDKEEVTEFPAVNVPDYEQPIIIAEAIQSNTIDVEAEELTPVKDETEEAVEETTVETPAVKPEPVPEQPTHQPVQNNGNPYQAMYQQPVYSTPVQYQKPLQQVFETPIDISDRPMLQMIRNASWAAGIESYFFQEPNNDLVKICYVATDGSNRRYLDDWLDPAGCYFPEPVIIPNKAVPLLYQAIINIDENSLRDYMQWKRNPMLCPQMNEYIINYVPDRLVTDVCYSTHEIVKHLDAANTHILKTSLISLLNFLDSVHPELAGIRWHFVTYESPEKFTLEPEEFNSSTRGIIFHTSKQMMNVSIVFDNGNKDEKIKIVQKAVDAAQSAADATLALKASLNKGNPVTQQPQKPKKQTGKKQPAKKSATKKSDEEAADAEAIAASK